MSLAGKRVFVTGGSRGIGLEIAKRIARDGAKVAIAAKTAEPNPKLPGTIFTAAEEIEAAGGTALPLVTDIRDESAIVAADGRSLARALRVAGKVEPLFCEDLKRLQEAVIEHARDGDVVIAMGAGSIGSLAANIQRSLVSEDEDD